MAFIKAFGSFPVHGASLGPTTASLPEKATSKNQWLVSIDLIMELEESYKEHHGQCDRYPHRDFLLGSKAVEFN